MPPANWMNDPDGFIRWRGSYHLFYQHNPDAPVWGNMHWGHVVSDDLVAWRHLPIALAPDIAADIDGVWSGCCVDDNGVPTIVYTGISGAPGPRVEQVLIATGDDDLVHWTKNPQPVIAAPPEGMKVIGFRDPFVFRDAAGGWRMIIGSGTTERGGQILHYRSPDLRSWRYAGVLLDRSGTNSPLTDAPMWEYPQLVRLPDRDLLLFTPLDGNTQLVPPMIEGHLTDEAFVVDRISTMDSGPAYSSPCVFEEGPNRTLAFAWLHELSSPDTQKHHGWSGVMSLPREFAVEGGRLCMRLPREVDRLRDKRAVHVPEGAGVSSPIRFELPPGPIEIELIAEVSGKLTIELTDHVAGDHPVCIAFDAKRRELSLAISSDPRFCPDLPATLGAVHMDERYGDRLYLRIFVDASVIEVFANDHAALTGRLYRSGRLQTASASGDGFVFDRLHTWTLAARS